MNPDDVADMVANGIMDPIQDEATGGSWYFQPGANAYVERASTLRNVRTSPSAQHASHLPSGQSSLRPMSDPTC